MMTSAFRWQDNDLIVQIKVQPKASCQQILGIEAEYLKIKLRSLPAKGAANKELISLLAKTFGVAKTTIQVLNGSQSRYKTLLIPNPSIIPGWLI